MLWIIKEVAWYVGATILGRLLRERPPEPKKQQAEPFRLPTIDPSRPIRVIAGQVYINDPAVIWYGRVVKTRLLGHNNNDFDVWSVAVHLGLCLGPVDAAPEIFWDGKPLTDYTQNPGGVGTNSWGISAQRWDKLMPSELLANPFFLESYKAAQKDGYTFYAGSQDQVADVFLIYEGFTAAPAYHGLCNLILWRVFLGPSSVGAPSMQRISVGLQRRPNSLGITAGHETIGVGCNAVCLIYEILTDAIWACGMPSTVIDIPGFRAAAETLYNEGFGISMDLAEQREAGAVIDDICAHINAVVFPDPETAMVKIKLIRNDYVAANLPLFDDSNAQGIELSRLGWHETKNIVRVHYAGAPGIAVVNGSTRVAVETNLANAQIVGGLNSQDVDYPMIQDPAVAQAVAARDLRALSYPLARVELEPDRTAYTLRPGDALRVSSVIKNIPETVCRVGRLGLGRLEEGRMHIGAVEDVFSAGWTGIDAAGAGSMYLMFPKMFGGAAAPYTPALMRVGPVGEDVWGTLGTAMASPARYDSTNVFLLRTLPDGSDGTFAFWSDNRTPQNVYGQRFDASGNPLWGLGVSLAVPPSGGLAGHFSICLDGAGGVIVAWCQTSSPTFRIYCQRLTASGAPLWAAGGVPLSTATVGSMSKVSVCSDGAGGAFVAWEDATFQNAYTQRINADGSLAWVAAAIKVNASGGSALNPKVCPTADGGVFVIWERPSTNVRVQKYSGTGAAQFTSAGIQLTGSGSLKEVFPDGSGGFLMRRLDNSAAHVFVYRFDANGALVWSVDCGAFKVGGLVQDTGGASDGAGGFLVCMPGSTSPKVTVGKVSSAGVLVWSTSVAVGSTGFTGACVIAPDGAGGALVAWMRVIGSDTSLYIQRVDQSGQDRWAPGGIEIIPGLQSFGSAYLAMAAIVVHQTVATPVAQTASAVITASATVTPTATLSTLKAAAVLTCTATVAALAAGTGTLAAVIACAATVAPKGTATYSGKAALAATATVSGTATVTAPPTASLTARATVSAVGTV